MTSPTSILRFAPLACILATFPALGQVENAPETRAATNAAPDARASGSDGTRAIQAPRLLASEPRIDDMPRVEIAEAPRSAPEPAVPAARRVAPAPPEPVEIDAVAGAAAIHGRPAALSVATPREPPAAPAPRAAPMSTLDMAANWAEIARDHAALHWRQIGLVTFMVIAAGLLFWRLGERGRLAVSEPVAAAEVASTAAPVEAEESLATEEAVASETLVFAQEPEPDAFNLPPMPAMRMPAAVREEELPRDGPVIRPAAQVHRTLREALSAMKADMARRQSALET